MLKLVLLQLVGYLYILLILIKSVVLITFSISLVLY